MQFFRNKAEVCIYLYQADLPGSILNGMDNLCHTFGGYYRRFLYDHRPERSAAKAFLLLSVVWLFL